MLTLIKHTHIARLCKEEHGPRGKGSQESSTRQGSLNLMTKPLNVTSPLDSTVQFTWTGQESEDDEKSIENHSLCPPQAMISTETNAQLGEAERPCNVQLEK